MKKMLKSTGLVCPHLSRKFIYLLLLLVTLIGGANSAWADEVTIKTIDFTSSDYSTYRTNRTISSNTTVDGCKYVGDFAITDAGIVSFPSSSNMSKDRYMAILITGIKKEFTFTINDTKGSDGNSTGNWKCNYAVIENFTSLDDFTYPSSTTETSRGTTITTKYTMKDNTKNSAILLLGRQGSGYTSFGNITITTPKVIGDLNGGDWFNSFSDDYTIKDGEAYQFSFTNTSATEQNYYTWCLLGYQGGTNKTAIRPAGDWEQSRGTQDITYQGDGATFDNYIALLQSGSKTTVTAYYHDSKLYVSAVNVDNENNRKYILNYTSNELQTGDVTLKFTTDHATISDLSFMKISAQPQSATYTQFDTATPLSVTATAPNAECTYQWQQEKNNVWTDIDKATSATYTPATTTVGSIKYRCVVSAEGFDPMNSDEATITINGGSNTVSDLVEIVSGDVYTPSAAIPLQTLTFNSKIISAGGGNDYKSGFGLNFKDNRYIAFKVPAGSTIIVEAGNHGNSGDRTIWLGNSDSNNDGKKNLETQVVAQGATGTLTYKYETGGVIYLSASGDLYLKKLSVTNGFRLNIDFNGHSSENISFDDQTNLEDPLRTPTADGYTFVGWYTDRALTSVAIPGATLTGETTLYAKWMINKGNTVPLNGNGITTTLDHIVVPQSGMSVTLPTAYESATNIDIPANTVEQWNAKDTPINKKVVYDTFFEAYYNAGVGEGNVLTQSVTGLTNGRYEVVLDVAASATNIRDFKTQENALPTGQELTQAFAGTATQYIPVIDRTAFDPATDYDRVVLVTNVTDGTLTYGIKNDKASGNWYVCRVHSIKKIDDSNFTGWDTKADGTGIDPDYSAGADYAPNYNGTVLYAQWKKTYTFRPVFSNGTATITVGGETKSMENNHVYKIDENAKIVMTVAPESGYKFKNWSVTGTTGTESGMTYTIEAINADTKLTAKFEALGTATDPNPANGTLEGTTVTINPFPASYGGKSQDIDLGLPTGATFTVTSGDASNVDDKLRITAPTAPGNASYTINVVAEDGTTNKSYTVNVSTVEGASFSYTVNAVDGSGNTLKEIISGVYAEGTGGVKIAYPQNILVGSKLYRIANNSSGDYFRKTITPNTDNFVENLTYSTTVNDVVYLTEAEDIKGMSTGNYTVRASLALGRCDNYLPTVTLKKGTYKISCRGVNSNSGNQTFSFKAGETEVFNVSLPQGNNNIWESSKFIVSEETTIYVKSSGSSSSGLDWFYIQQDLSVLPVTEDGQVEYLNETNVKNHKYFPDAPASNWASRKEDGVDDKFLDMKTNRKIKINTYGATAFEVFVHGNTDRTYTIKVGSGEAKNYTCKTSGLESSGIIATGSNNSDVVIELDGGSSTVYPVKVKFYTKQMIIGAESTVTMGKAAVVETLNATGGTLEMVTPSAQAVALVTASFNASTNQLTLTPLKAGTAHLTFNIKENETILNTVEYIVNVVKQQVTMTYLAGGKDTYNATDGDFTSPTLVVKDEAGTDITSAVTSSLLYISDDETLVKYSGTTPQLIPNVIGSAKLKAVLYNNDIYENALATFTVNVSAGIDMKLYHVDSEGNKVGEHVPEINTTLVAKDDDGNTLMTMTYGGYKYGQYTHFSKTEKDGSKSKVTDTWKGDKGDEDVFKAYDGQGSDIYGQPFDNQIDDYGFQTQAQYDSRDEYNRGIQWFTTNEVKTDGSTHYTKNERIKPFSLPVKGAYLKFEAEVNGTLTAYVLQNGNINFDSGDNRDKPKSGDPLGSSPRVYYWFNQDGYRIDPTSFTSKQPLTIGRDYNEDVVKELKVWTDANSELKSLLEGGGWPTQSEVNANLKKPVPTPQPVVRYQNGYMVAQKAYVKYVIPVVAGDTYYFFSNASKVGAAGFNFLPDEDGTVELILPENGGSVRINANTNDTRKDLNCTSDNATTHKTTNTIEMYKEVTLPRKFKVNTWSTICLPFHVTEPQVEKVFGKGTNLIIFNGLKGTTARFQKHVNQDILAGQPYLIYPTGVDAEGNDLASVYEIGDEKWIGGQETKITFTNVNFTPNVAVQSYASDKDGDEGADGYGTQDPSYIFTGTLGQASVKQYDYYVNNNTGEITRYTGSNDVTLNAYYAYLKNAAENPTSAKAISGISFMNVTDDDYDAPTGIMDILINEMNMEIKPVGGVYNLSGQKVSDSTKNLPKGIYIINGQKVNIK